VYQGCNDFELGSIKRVAFGNWAVGKKIVAFSSIFGG
jgi:hypothetical protein